MEERNKTFMDIPFSELIETYNWLYKHLENSMEDSEPVMCYQRLKLVKNAILSKILHVESNEQQPF